MILRAGERAVRDFRTWSEQEGHPRACSGCLDSLLEGRAAYLGRADPTRWRRGDVRALLYELAVPRLSEQCELAAHTVPAVDAYLVFLDETDRLHPGSTAVRHLRQELAQHAGGFPAAMVDRSRFRMAKTIYQAMLADGVPIDDAEAVDAWTARFNHAPEEARAVVLEHLLGARPELLTAQFVAREGKVAALAPGHEPFDSRRLLPPEQRTPDVQPVFPPVDVPSRAQAVEAARRSSLLGDLLQLVRWIGQGRKATKDGELIPADLRELAHLLGRRGHGISRLRQMPDLEALFWLARQLELIDLRRTGLVAGPRLTAWQDGEALAAQDDAEVLDLWREVFALVETGHDIPEEAFASKDSAIGTVFETARRCAPGAMVALYRSAALDRREPVAALIASHTIERLGSPHVIQRQAEEELADVGLRIGLALTLDRLAEHGVLELSGTGLTELAVPSETPPDGLPPRAVLMASSDQVWVRLTPLGRWALRETLLAEGAEAPSTVLTP